MMAGLMCLALTIYFEARGESFQSQVAVGHVVINRVKSPDFPNTICEVTTEGGEYRHRCQFSWYCDGKSDKTPDQTAWEQALVIAQGVHTGNLDDFVEGATHYHATYVLPEWADSKTPVVQIGDHMFYRWD